jgi:hypothetical protein
MGHVFRPDPVHLTRPAVGDAGAPALRAAPGRPGLRGPSRRPVLWAAAALLLAACGSAPPDTRPSVLPLAPPPSLPDETGWGVHVLAMSGGPNRSTWVGSWDGRIFRLPHRAREWELVETAPAAPGPVNSLAFERDTAVVWYGTAGGGFARSGDGGSTWRAWPQAEGAGWNYVVPRGIVVRRDTVYVATTDGLRLSGDGGATWYCYHGPGAAAPPVEDGCTQRSNTLPTSHLLSLEVLPDGAIYIGHLRGLSSSRNGGRSWTDVETPGLAGERVRSVRLGPDSMVWALTERELFADSPRVQGFRRISLRVPGFPELPGSPRAIITQPGLLPVLVATSYGMLAETPAGDYRLHFLSAADRYRPAGDIWAGGWWGPPMIPIGGSSAGLNRVLAGESPVPAFIDAPPRQPPAPGQHLRFARPVLPEAGNPYADGTRLFGGPAAVRPATAPFMAIRFQNPPGTEVRAIGPGTVAVAADGRVTIRHDGAVDGHLIHSTYEGLGSAGVASGQRVAAGAVIGQVGGTLRPHGVTLSIQVVRAGEEGTPAAAGQAAGGAGETASSVNPQLFLEPLPGTGVVAGRVLNAAGEPVPGTAIHGLVLAYPTEAPFSVVRTYAPGVPSSPVYGEHFALGDVRAGDYLLGVTLDGQRIWRRVRVVPGQVAWVEFRP